jgi:hypothetical protein
VRREDVIAHHEAAHAVVALALDLPVSQVTLEVREWGLLGSTGHALPDDYSPEAYPAMARSIIVASLAGITAEERLVGAVDVPGARGDLESAFESADALPVVSGRLRECQTEARRLVAERWAAIEAVARALLRSSKGWLDADELRDVLASGGSTRPSARADIRPAPYPARSLMADDRDSMFDAALTASASIAYLNKLPMTLVLKNGDTFEGVLTAVESMFGARFGGVTIDPQPGDDPPETYEWTLTIDGRQVLAQEIAAFTVKRP